PARSSPTRDVFSQPGSPWPTSSFPSFCPRERNPAIGLNTTFLLKMSLEVSRESPPSWSRSPTKKIGAIAPGRWRKAPQRDGTPADVAGCDHNRSLKLEPAAGFSENLGSHSP